MNTVDPEFFPHNIREGYRLRKERFENQGNEEFEVDRNLFELIKGSNQIIHKRGRVLGYLGGEDKKRKLQAADFEDEAMRDDEGPEAKRIRHKYARAIEIDDSLINKLTQEYEKAYFKPSQPDAHQSKRRLWAMFCCWMLIHFEAIYQEKTLITDRHLAYFDGLELQGEAPTPKNPKTQKTPMIRTWLN